MAFNMKSVHFSLPKGELNFSQNGTDSSKIQSYCKSLGIIRKTGIIWHWIYSAYQGIYGNLHWDDNVKTEWWRNGTEKTIPIPFIATILHQVSTSTTSSNWFIDLISSHDCSMTPWKINNSFLQVNYSDTCDSLLKREASLNLFLNLLDKLCKKYFLIFALKCVNVHWFVTIN